MSEAIQAFFIMQTNKTINLPPLRIILLIAKVYLGLSWISTVDTVCITANCIHTYKHTYSHSLCILFYLYQSACFAPLKREREQREEQQQREHMLKPAILIN